MSELLKGNYKIPNLKDLEEPEDEEQSLEQKFEAEALKKLGGSITFVKLPKGFVWKGDKKDE